MPPREEEEERVCRWEISPGRVRAASNVWDRSRRVVTVHIRGSVQADTRMAMVAVIPIEEIPTEVSGLLNGAETSREFHGT